MTVTVTVVVVRVVAAVAGVNNDKVMKVEAVEVQVVVTGGVREV